MTKPTSDEHGHPALRYRITHVPSGEYDEDVMPLMCASLDPQGQGSALTYARRYALLAVLNLAPGEDDDGASAGRALSRAPSPDARYADAQAREPAVVQPVAVAAKPSERPASAKQQGMIAARARQADLTDAELANVILFAAGEQPRVWHQESAAASTLKRLLDRLPARLVDQVLDGIARNTEAGR
jgi:ERF superfamily